MTPEEWLEIYIKTIPDEHDPDYYEGLREGFKLGILYLFKEMNKASLDEYTEQSPH